jgi:RNA polymerase sigma-70 factor, ECF subfamily
MSKSNLALDYERLDDGRLVELARAGDPRAFRAIMQRHNRRLYRTARGVLGDDTEAEDVVQDAYLNAFKNLAGFRGEASLATWLTRIALNEALGRKRRQRPSVGLETLDHLSQEEESRVVIFPGARPPSTPEAETGRAEMRRILEQAVDQLPEPFRLVFVLREMEQMSVEETATQLQLREETVKTRLHRARKLLRVALEEKLGGVVQESYGFDGERCERLTTRVLQRIGMADPRA